MSHFAILGCPISIPGMLISPGIEEASNERFIGALKWRFYTHLKWPSAITALVHGREGRRPETQKHIVKGIGRSSCPNLFKGFWVMKEVDPYPWYKIMIHTVLFGSNPFPINFIHHSKPSERVWTGGASNGFKTFSCRTHETSYTTMNDKRN